MKQTEIKLIIDDVHNVPKLYINNKLKEHIVSVEYRYITDNEQPGTHRYTITYLDKDEQGNAYERSIELKKFPYNETDILTLDEFVKKLYDNY